MLSENALIGDRFIKYTAVFATFAYKNSESSGAASIIILIHVIIVLIDRLIIPF
jgi:hypothetical protein